MVFLGQSGFYPMLLAGKKLDGVRAGMAFSLSREGLVSLAISVPPAPLPAAPLRSWRAADADISLLNIGAFASVAGFAQ